MASGNYQAKVAKANAGLEYEAARDSEDQGRRDSLSFYRQVGRLKGDQIAAMAANGIDVGFGSAARVQDDTASLAREDAGNVYRNTYERTRGNLINAANFVSEAKSARSQGQAAMIGSLFQAGGSLMGGFQQQRFLKAKLGVGG
jgi:hypothetical protein